MSGLWYVNLGYGREELARAAYELLEESLDVLASR